jgi:hypothetical protein
LGYLLASTVAGFDSSRLFPLGIFKKTVPYRLQDIGKLKTKICQEVHCGINDILLWVMDNFHNRLQQFIANRGAHLMAINFKN